MKGLGYIIVSGFFVLSIIGAIYYYNTKKDVIPIWVGYFWAACIIAYIGIFYIKLVNCSNFQDH